MIKASISGTISMVNEKTRDDYKIKNKRNIRVKIG